MAIRNDVSKGTTINPWSPVSVRSMQAKSYRQMEVYLRLERDRILPIGFLSAMQRMEGDGNTPKADRDYGRSQVPGLWSNWTDMPREKSCHYSLGTPSTTISERPLRPGGGILLQKIVSQYIARLDQGCPSRSRRSINGYDSIRSDTHIHRQGLTSGGT